MEFFPSWYLSTFIDDVTTLAHLSRVLHIDYYFILTVSQDHRETITISGTLLKGKTILGLIYIMWHGQIGPLTISLHIVQGNTSSRRFLYYIVAWLDNLSSWKMLKLGNSKQKVTL